MRTDGNRILDGGGQLVVLRGINRIGFEVLGKHPPIADSEMEHARSWGANAIRVPLGQAYTNPKCPGQYVPDYFESVDRAVASITSRGMVALLDLHTSTRVTCGESARWRMADKPGSVDFWRAVAARYGPNPLVAFDLYNEPHDITTTEWLHGGELVDWSLTGPVRWRAAGMQDLYDAVRSTGAMNVVVITANGYGGNPSAIAEGHGVNGVNIVYATHAYTCPEPRSAQFCTTNAENRHHQIKSLWKQVAATHPVMITEFGWPDPSEAAYNASVIRHAESHDPPWGWTAFAWDGKTKGGFALVADLDTYEATPAGSPVKQALESVSGATRNG